MRERLASWFVLLCLIVLIGAHILPAPTSHFTSGDASNTGKLLAFDPALVGVGRIGTGEQVRKLVPSITTCAQNICTRFGHSPPIIGHAVTAFPHTHALRVHQRISVYRI